MTRCKGSGTRQMLTWMPDAGYPGGAICVSCSRGVLVRVNSVQDDVSMTGFPGKSGVLRVHAEPKKEKRS